MKHRASTRHTSRHQDPHRLTEIAQGSPASLHTARDVSSITPSLPLPTKLTSSSSMHHTLVFPANSHICMRQLYTAMFTKELRVQWKGLDGFMQSFKETTWLCLFHPFLRNVKNMANNSNFLHRCKK